MITGFYIAIFALVQAAMVVWIAKSRYKERVVLGTGDSETLEQKSRVYGNFVEVVPIATLLMLVAELGGAPLWTIHWMGALMILSRLLHAKGMLTPPGYGPYRMAGMLFAMAAFILGAGICISLALPRMLLFLISFFVL